MTIKERVCIFIDGSNLYNSLKELNSYRVDFQKLINVLVKERKLIFVFYYNASLDITMDSKRYWKQQKFFDELRKIPLFNVILCKMRKFKDKNKVINYEVKGDDVHLTVDLISGAYEDIYDIAIIVSGDEDFVPAIDKIKSLGKKVENAYFISSSSSALKRASNESICMNKLLKEMV